MTTQTVPAQTAILGHIKMAQQELDAAIKRAMAANSLAGEVPVFQQLERIKKELTAAMQQVGKMRGLG